MVKAFITVKSIDEFGPGKTRMIAVPRRAPNKVKLNDLTLKNLKPRDARAYLVWDTETRGLIVQVQPSGHLSIKYIYSRRGRPRWYSIGRIDMGLLRPESAHVRNTG